VRSGLLAPYRRYRRAGATLPFGDPALDHGAAFEGYFWRFTDTAHGRVVIALCGLSRSGGGRWALAALAEHPSHEVRTAMVPQATGDPSSFAVRASEVVTASARSVSFALGPEAGLEAEISEARPFPRRALGASGAAQAIPGLPQYWNPYLLGGRARGLLTLGDERISLDGATVYAEKNWGSSFPERWWWGQADDFEGADACVAFAGGPVRVSGLAMRSTLVAARLGARTLVLAPPLALATADVGAHGWRIRARSALHRVEIEGEDAGTAVTLPVPVPGRRAAEPRSHQALAGTLRVTIRRGRRILLRGESTHAGLEVHR
jgi:hypothetical protein